ncbi:Ring finger domain-containing protein [Apiospora saccharicola]
MDSPRPAVDLEKELTCSVSLGPRRFQICTEVLYQPLTLLDCLHTFCGSCLRDWFSWQANAAENSPNPPPAGANIATCPSCRAPVRDTRHNATVATLLEMFLSAHPDKARSDADKDEMHQKYKPGDNVVPKIRGSEKSPEEQRTAALERQMLEQARELSLRDAGVSSSSGHRQARHRREQHVRDHEGSSRSDRESSRDSRHRDDTHDRTRRAHREEERRRRAATDPNVLLQPGSSIRSLISSSDVDSRDMEKEIEEFARQIQEEGLLDGLDLSNLDLAQNDELSRKITEAYRRRQLLRSRQESSRRTNASSPARRRETSVSSSRPPISDTSRSSSRNRANSAHARSSSSTSMFQESSRPPVTATHLEATGGATFSERASAAQHPASPPLGSAPETINSTSTKRRPASLVVSANNPLPSLGMPSSPNHGRTRSMSQYYSEPSITCSRCSRPHIEYELHYNCGVCHNGDWNLCLNCYRTKQGCLHWFGFGYSAFNRWERAQEKAEAEGNEQLEPPHMLTSNRYLPPKATPGGADGRRTMTTEDPMKRLQSGMFCARCSTWANECYWRCEWCNEGDWGFCNNCVNQGHCCTHPLLPLTHFSHPATRNSPPASPRSPKPPPPSASLLTGPNSFAIGDFRPLTFTTTCDICRRAIAPSQSRYHCYACTSTVVPDTEPGDYDICMPCYDGLASSRRISSENGPNGWRRCPKGHRMVIVGFKDAKRGGQVRYVAQDLVGGWDLRSDPYNPSDPTEQQIGLEKWRWSGPDRSKIERLVTVDVAATAPTGPPWSTDFPANGGCGMKTIANWSWYPQAGSEDELLFPRGAEVLEVEDVNSDWFFGCYMGSTGLFLRLMSGLLETREAMGQIMPSSQRAT